MSGEISQIVDAQNADKKRTNTRSLVEFTYLGLDDSEAIAIAIREIGVTACEWDQLAAKLDYAPRGGGFRVRLLTARAFGLITYDQGRVELTESGLRIVDPETSRAARVSAFLAVELFKMTFDRLKGQTLPPVAAIDRLIGSFGVSPKQTAKARQAFMRSAKHAGFFEMAPDKLVIPPNLGAAQIPAQSNVQPNQAANDHVVPNSLAAHRQLPGSGSGPGNGGGDSGGIHPAILGLLRDLPSTGTTISAKRRESLKNAFSAALDYIYPDPED